MRISQLLPLLLLTAALPYSSLFGENFRTCDATLGVDEKGFITSLVPMKSGKQYSPAGRPSALMSPHVSGKPNGELVVPTSAAYDAATKSFTLK